MKLIIDGEVKNWSFDDELTLEQLIQETNDRLILEHSRLISDVKLDEYDSSLAPELTWDQVTIDKVYKLSLSTQSIREYISTLLSAASKINSDIRKSIPGIIKDISSENIQNAMTNFQSCIDGMINIFSAIRQYESSGYQLESELTIRDMSFNEFLTSFNNTLSEILESMNNSDNTLINDFLEYELEPALVDLGSFISALKDKIQV